MMEKLSRKSAEAFVQYSKKMCTRVSVFWMIYRLANFIVVLILPNVAPALVDLSAGVDTIMIVNMSTYLLNSSTEKVAIAFGKNKLHSAKYDKEDNSEDEGNAEDDPVEDDSTNG